MSPCLSLYDILGVAATATADEIKSAFRESALRHHPDRNDNRPASTTRFRVIYNAYSVLSDAEKRREYDAYLETSSVFGGSSGPSVVDPTLDRSAGRIAGMTSMVETLLGHLNYVLWDTEDFIRTKPDWNRTVDGLPLRAYVLRLLAFIDKWILSKTGFPDYFFEARRMSAPAEFGMLSDGGRLGHRPFADIEDYFYNVRARADKFMNSAKLSDVLEPIRGTAVRVMDCILEAHNLGVHYLCSLKRALQGETESVAAFRHSASCFGA